MDDLLGIGFVAHETQRQAECSPLMVTDELAEGTTVSSLHSKDKVTVALRFGLSRLSIGRKHAPSIHITSDRRIMVDPMTGVPSTGYGPKGWNPWVLLGLAMTLNALSD